MNCCELPRVVRKVRSPAGAWRLHWVCLVCKQRYERWDKEEILRSTGWEIDYEDILEAPRVPRRRESSTLDFITGGE